ncbi:MAG: heavy metal sensor histidine kinase [Gammaproteobacteria bacterium]|nr:heavy metal sensor histidine kinase [Gammaproteobacteria bacterium]
MQPPRPPSLTLRLTLLFGVVAIVVFTGFGWFIERSIEHHFSVGDDAELEIIAQTVSQVLASRADANSPETIEQRLTDILVGHHGALLHIAGQDGRGLFASTNGPALSAISAPLPGNREGRENNALFHWNDTAGHNYRMLTRRVAGVAAGGMEDMTLSVAVAIDHHQQFLAGFRHTLWLMIASGILVMGFMGWFAVRQGHGPLRAIVARIRHISAAELNTRLPPESMPRELTDLALAFNDMLARMEEAFQRLSNFSADIAHELRTPVTNLLTQTQVALSKSRSENEYREILYSNMEEYERMAQMIGDMLFLAKADNGLYQPDSIEIDLHKEVQELFEYYEAWAEERGVSLELDGAATTPGDRLMLRRALGNLLSNAIRHTPANHTVKVLLHPADNQSVTISVENPGPPIPQEHIPRLFDRFYRVDTSRQRGCDGAGLGLAITKSIIDLHGGNIEATSGDKGTRFRITLPAALKAIP